MHAVVKTGGKQYRVAQGDVITVEKIEAEDGAKVKLESLMIGDKIVSADKPQQVEAEVVGQTRADKVIVFKKKRRKGYRRTQGHRQSLTQLKITKISA